MKRVHAIPLLFIAAALAGTFAVVALRQPDVIRATGDDGRVRVDGHGVGMPVISRVGERSGTAIPVEDISLGGLPLPAGFTITLAYDPAVRAQAAQGLSLFAFDASLGAWQAVPSVDDPATSTLAGDAAVASRRWTYAPLPDPMVGSEAPVVFDQLVSSPPPGAVGYRAFAAVATQDDDFFLLNADEGRGGCAAMFHQGSSQTVTSHDVTEDGKTTRYEVRWELGGGCAAGERLAPAL